MRRHAQESWAERDPLWECSQCVDRRFGAYGAELDDMDEGGIYAADFLHEKVENEDETRLMDYHLEA